MSKAHYIQPTGAVSEQNLQTVRLGAGTGSTNNLVDLDVNKFVKLVAESRYDLCAAGDALEAAIVSTELATSGGYTVGTIIRGERGDCLMAIADGLQATAGTGTVAIGDRVVTGTVSAKGTANTLGYPKVCTATVQPGAVPGSLTAAGAQVLASLNSWRVVSLLTGAGAVGTQIVIEKE